VATLDQQTRGGGEGHPLAEHSTRASNSSMKPETLRVRPRIDLPHRPWDSFTRGTRTSRKHS